MIVCQAVAQFADKTSACSRTVSVAISCLSGVSPYLQRIRLDQGSEGHKMNRIPLPSERFWAPWPSCPRCYETSDRCQRGAT